MDVIIAEEDDGNRDGITKCAIYDGDDEIVPLRDRIIGRCSSRDIVDPTNPSQLIVKAGDVITEEAAKYDDIYCEWAPNEKVAMESAFGASLAGRRALCAQKQALRATSPNSFALGADLLDAPPV